MRTMLILMVLAGPLGAETFQADIWADNWFALSVNGALVKEDSVSITTERSFNSEQFAFSATRPFVLALTAKDYKENDTGLEYIGTRRQQMGDGGVIGQFRASDGTVIVTDDKWRCLVVHMAPAHRSCAKERTPTVGQGACASVITPEPEGWKTFDFDDAGWLPATEWSARAVRPKDGYDRVKWDRSARLIWGPDLERDNTLLCRRVVR